MGIEKGQDEERRNEDSFHIGKDRENEMIIG